MTRCALGVVLVAVGLLPLAGCSATPPVAPGSAPGEATALGGAAPAPVLDEADDPDTVSPVEPGDAPGDAGTLTPAGAGSAAAAPAVPSCCLPSNPRLRAIVGAP